MPTGQAGCGYLSDTWMHQERKPICNGCRRTDNGPVVALADHPCVFEVGSAKDHRSTHQPPRCAESQDAIIAKLRHAWERLAIQLGIEADLGSFKRPYIDQCKCRTGAVAYPPNQRMLCIDGLARAW